MSVTNRINNALGRGANDRELGDITQIVVHHTATLVHNNQNTATFENSWSRNTDMGFPDDVRGGYHEVILLNGNVEINMQDRRRTWGAALQNTPSWHIAMVGQNNTHQLLGINNIHQQQLDRLAERIALAFGRFGWNRNHLNRIVRHRDLPGHSNNGCNNVNLTDLRNAVRNLLPVIPSLPPTINSFTGPSNVVVPPANSGQSITVALNWTTTNATSVAITASTGTAFVGSNLPPNGGRSHTFGSASISTGTRVLTLRATGPGGTATRTLSMTITRGTASTTPAPSNFRHFVPRGNFSNVRNGGAGGAINTTINRGNWIRVNDSNNTWVLVQGAQGNPALGANPHVLSGNEYNIRVQSNGVNGVIDGGTRSVIVTGNNINARRWPVNGTIEATIPNGTRLDVRFRSHADGGAGSGRWAQVQNGAHAGRWVSLDFVRNA